MRDLEDDRGGAATGEGGARRRGPRLALCGSSDLEHYPESLIAFIEGQPITSTILLRRGNKSSPGRFEKAMALLAAHLWMDVEWVRPDENEPLPPPEDGSVRSLADESRARVYLRDVEYVRRADIVLAFFSSIEMSGGTGHVVEKAIDQDVPVYSWGYDGQRFVRIGEHDPFGAWAASVPA